MEEKVLIFNTEEEARSFQKALERASLGQAVVKPDHGFTKPALRVRGMPSHVLAAALWAGFEPKAVI
jgi:hypothetical protein